MAQPFQPCPDLGELHPYERLNYVLGQVLGVQDFQQEQAYFLHKSRLQNRALHGYGTVWGLEVSTSGSGDDLKIEVSPGLAIDGQGREVLVDQVQCARLNAWLAAAVSEGSTQRNGETLKPVSEGNGSPVAVYVTLCYHPCPTGAQPILGNPCRVDSGDEGVIQYTRNRDEFELRLSPQPPIQYEEAHIRAMGDLLAKIEIVPPVEETDPPEDPSPGGDSDPPATPDPTQTTLEQLQDHLRNPSGISEIDFFQIPENEVDGTLRDLLRYWITSIRPHVDEINDPIPTLLEKITESSDSDIAPLNEEVLSQKIIEYTNLLHDYLLTYNRENIENREPEPFHRDTKVQIEQAIHDYWNAQSSDCILLASVQFTLPAGDNVLGEDDLDIVNLQRPYLLQTRLLQELILQRLFQEGNPEFELGEGDVTYESQELGREGEETRTAGVYQARNPQPLNANIAFDVVMPNPPSPILGRGIARYLDPADSSPDQSGVIPLFPTPDDLDPPLLNRDPSLPDDANVAFDVVLPAWENGDVYIVGDTPNAGSNVDSPAELGVYPKISITGQPSFDVVIPGTSSGTMPDLRIGEVRLPNANEPNRPSVSITRTPSSSSLFLNFIIPRGSDGRSGLGLNQLIIRPTELLMVEIVNNSENVLSLQDSLEIIDGCPALSVRPTQSISLSAPRPNALNPDQYLTLNIYYAIADANDDDKSTSIWKVEYRWGTDFGPQTSFSDAVEMGSDLSHHNNGSGFGSGLARFQLSPYSESTLNSLIIKFRLKSLEEREGEGEFIKEVSILMTELTWGE